MELLINYKSPLTVALAHLQILACLWVPCRHIYTLCNTLGWFEVQPVVAGQHAGWSCLCRLLLSWHRTMFTCSAWSSCATSTSTNIVPLVLVGLPRSVTTGAELGRTPRQLTQLFQPTCSGSMWQSGSGRSLMWQSTSVCTTNRRSSWQTVTLLSQSQTSPVLSTPSPAGRITLPNFLIRMLYKDIGCSQRC